MEDNTFSPRLLIRQRYSIININERIYGTINSNTISSKDVAYMQPDNYNDGYWYNIVTGKILTQQEVEKLNLNETN